jgi:isoaspartyl peptidase/L-asparaginase-like protein (Ntn-hydrolase superfamily)
MKGLWFVLLVMASGTVLGQALDPVAVVQQTFDGMAARDSLILAGVVHPEASIHRWAQDSLGNWRTHVVPGADFISEVGAGGTPYIERMGKAEVVEMGEVATVVAPYDFRVNERFSHCGVDVVNLVRVEGEWQVVNLAYTVEGTDSATCAERFPSLAPRLRREWAIAIHGGAGHFGEEDLSPELQALYAASLERVLAEGETMLAAGASAVDVVEALINQFENDSLFNAGRGAVYTAEGRHELDASIADGANRNAGAVTGLVGFKHPISVARGVMDSSEHVFFSGPGAAEFASGIGAEEAPEGWFDTQKARARYERLAGKKHGTVGCVVLDAEGHLAAGTSTGGMTFKRHGRIGDSPVIGAGTWADDRSCAVSATGWGEYFIRTGVAHEIHGRMMHGGVSLAEACRGAIFDEMGALGGDGGVVAVDAKGNIALVFNSTGMFRAWAHPADRGVAMFGGTGTGTGGELRSQTGTIETY